MEMIKAGLRLLACFVPAAIAAQAQPQAATHVEGDNQTYASVLISRMGEPDTQEIATKRNFFVLELPLAPGDNAGPAQMLQVSFTGSATVPETSFDGFNGRFGQAARLILIPPNEVRIQYPGTLAPGNADTNVTSATAGTGSVGTIDSSPVMSPAWVPASGTGTRPAKARYLQTDDHAGTYAGIVVTNTQGRQQLRFAAATGVRVNPINAVGGSESAAPGAFKGTQMIGMMPYPNQAAASAAWPPARQRKDWAAVFGWILPAALLAGLAAWKRMRRK